MVRNKHDLIQRTARGNIAVFQLPCNGWEISYNPDDDRWYVEYRTKPHNDLMVAATYAGDRKGFHNARQYARTHTPPM